jgi:16S rRNA processing protein RimM
LRLQHSLGKKTLLKDVEAIFIEEPKDNFIPHFIEKTSIKSDTETYIKLEGIDNKEVARKIAPKNVWLQEEDFNKHKAKAAPIALLGYDLIDGETNLGAIIEVNEMPHQILCTIIYKGNEALIPIHEANLLKMDDKNKKVYVDVPEGLLEIYG